jgi:ATP-dependent DNA ligase
VLCPRQLAIVRIAQCLRARFIEPMLLLRADALPKDADVINGLATLPDETVIDGEVVAFDEDTRPSFNVLQNYGSSKAPVVLLRLRPDDAGWTRTDR